MGKLRNQLLQAGGSTDQADQRLGLDALRDPAFLADLRRYYRSYKGRDFANDDELIAHYRQDYTNAEFNTADTALTALGGLDDGDDEKYLRSRLKQVYESLPKTIEGDAGNIARAILTDPTNLIGAAPSRGAQALARAGQMGRATGRAAAEAAVKEGAIAGGIGAAGELADQADSVQVGLQDEIDRGAVAGQGVLNAALGAGIGGTVAAIATRIGAPRAIAKENEALAKLGYPQAEISNLDQAAVDEILKTRQAYAPPPAADPNAPDTELEDAYARAMAPPEEPSTSDAGATTLNKDINRDLELDLDTIDIAYEQANEVRRQMARDGVDQDQLDFYDRYLNELLAVKELAPRLRDLREEVVPKLQGNDLGAERAAMARLSRIRQLHNLYLDVIEDPSPERVSALYERTRAGVDEAVTTETDAPAPQGELQTPESASEVVEGRTPIPEPQAEANATQAEADAPNAAKRSRKRKAKVAPEDEAEAERVYQALIEQGQRAHPEFKAALRQRPEVLEAYLRANTPDKAEAYWGYLKTRMMRDDMAQMSRDQKSFIRDLRAKVKRDNPDLDDQQIDLILAAKAATLNIPMAKDAPTGQPVTMGKNPDGTTQGILKPGQAIGDGYSVTDGRPPDISQKARDLGLPQGERMAREMYDRDIRVGQQLVPSMKAGEFVANGGERPLDAGGRRVQRGDVLWYDPATRSVYFDRKSFKGGDTPAPTPEEQKAARIAKRRAKLEASQVAASQVAPPPSADPKIDEIFAAMQKPGFNFDSVISDVLSKLPTAQPAERPMVAFVGPDVPAMRADGTRLAVLNKANPKDVRVLSEKQIAEGKGVSALIGKSNPEDFEIGYASGSSGSSAARRSFAPYAASDAAPLDTPKSEVRPLSREESLLPLDLSAGQAKRLADLIKRRGRIAIEASQARRGFSFAKLNELRLSQGQLTPLDVQYLYDEVTRASAMNKSVAHQKEVIAWLGDMAEFIGEIAPNGVTRTNIDVSQSIAQLNRIATKWDRREVAAAMKVVRQMASDGQGPTFRDDGTGPYYSQEPTGQGDATEVVNLTPGAFVPNVPLILHEMFHWALTNVLTPADHQAIWRATLKFYDGSGQLDRAALAAKTPGGMERHVAFDAKGQASVAGISNEANSPNEYAANQFSMWAMQNRAGVALQDVSFWKRMALYVENIYRRWFLGETVDEDLVPLFEKLLPESIADEPSDIGQFKTATGRAIYTHVQRLRTTMDELHAALADEGRYDGVIDAADRVAQALFGIRKFNVLGEEVGAMAFGLQRQIDEIVRAHNKPITGEVEDVAGRVYDPEAAANAIRDLVLANEQLQGKRYSLDDAYQLILSKSVSAFNRQRESFKLSADGANLVPKPAGGGYKQRMIARAKAAAKARRAGLKNRLEEATPAPARDVSDADLTPDAAVVVRRASADRLAVELETWSGTDYGNQLNVELMQRRKAEPVDGEAQRIVVRYDAVSRAIRREVDDYAGIASDVGVTPNAAATVREAQGFLTHRDPEKQAVMRTLFYRLANLGEAASGEGASVLSTDLVARLAGVTPDAAGRVFTDHKTSEFQALRTQLRRIASDLTDAISPDETVRSVAEMLVRSKLIPDDGLIEQSGVDFADVLGKHLRNEERPFGATEFSPRLRALAMKYQDALGYLLNGQIGNRDIKVRHPGLDNYGQMFGQGDDFTPPATTRQVADVVGDSARAAWEQAGPARRSQIKAFVGEGYGAVGGKPRPHYVATLEGLDDDALTPTIETSNFGPGVLVHESPEAIRDADIDLRLDAMITRAAEMYGPDSSEAEQLYELYDAVVDARETLRVARAKLGEIEANRRELGGDYFTAVREARDAMRLASDEFDAIAAEVASRGEEPMGAHPVYIRLLKPLDLTGDVKGHPIMGAFAQRAWDEGVIVEAEHLEDMVDAAAEIESAEDLYAWLGDLIEDGSGSRAQVEQTVTEILKDLGYDGMLTPEGTMLFDAGQAKHVNAATFDDSDFIHGEQRDLPFHGGSLAIAMIDRLDMSFAPVADMLERAGAPKELTSALNSMSKGRRLSLRENKAIRQAAISDILLASNSGRMRKNGMHWLADWVAPTNGTGHAERVASELGGIIQPITKALHDLPDFRKDALARIQRGTVGVFKSVQPASHARIVRALRHKPDSPAHRALSAQERKVYDLVRGQFDQMVADLQINGVMTGAIKDNYFPQVWNRDAIESHQERFLAGMANYMLREAKREGRVLNEQQAIQKAKSVFDNLINDDGVFVPPPGSSSNEIIGDHIDYQRLIRLDEDTESLKELEEFLESDLGAITTKYFETAVRKLDFQKRFGNGAHGWFDYLKVWEEGDDGAAKLLMTNRVIEKDLASTTPDGERTIMVLRRETEMPFKDDEAGALRAVRDLHDLIPQGPAAMRDYLMKLAPSESANGTYAKRVEAIVHGLIDREAAPELLHSQEIVHAKQTLRVLQHKPVEATAGSSSLAMRTSRFLRNFNSITMLSYATLSSFGDVVLPLVRSGDFKSWVDGMRKMAREPEYRQMLQNVGVSIENVVHERMVGLYGTGSTKLGTAFFNATGLTGWTNMMRQVAGSVGYEWFKAEYRLAEKHFDKMRPVTDQSPEFKRAYRHLKQYGLEYYWRHGVNIDTPDALKELPELRQAVIKFCNQTVFSPNPDDLPVVAQTPVGALVYQFKSFPLMAARSTREVLREAGLWKNAPGKGERDLRPLMALLIAAPAAGAVSMGAKDIIQQRGEGETFRDRSAADFPVVGGVLEAAGFGPNDNEAADAFIGWYLEGLMAAGGLGLLGDIIHDTAQNLDNGAFGATRTMATLFGPSVSDFMAAHNVLAGATDDNDDANGKERQAVREIIGRIPVAGGNKAFRESVVDSLAGEATN